MTIGRIDRLWIIAGVLVAVALVALGWFFFINPQNSQTSDFNAQAAVAREHDVTLEQRLAQLTAQNSKLSQYQAMVVAERQELPATSGMPDFLQELQTVGASSLVDVTSLSVAPPVRVSASAAAGAYSISINVVAGGTVDHLTQFLDQLQHVQPRAVLISQASLNWQPGQTLTLAMTAFVAPANGR
ncbi:MAG TPA: type 4a pilus biogenesis protein PilO [Jatrophihabitantaceae bacterium]|jgi:Tfp pilus assembly protein PilO|nr:type 4a pilus biogenesis protein PilO [Jatrophihabitantaceae bacterium]